MTHTPRILGAALVLFLSACTSDYEDAQEKPILQDSSHRLIEVKGFARPEAVRYDADQDVYFVSNFNGDSAGDSNGFISKVSHDGVILEMQFITGSDEAPLHGPRGMYITGETLWVADADGVHGFNRITGDAEAFIDFTSFEPGFLNDVAVAPNGSLYVTDTGNAAVYMARDGVVSVAVDSLEFPPNGITWDASTQSMVIAPWAGGQVFLHLDVNTHEIRPGVSGIGGNYDGIEYVGEDLIVTSQVDSSLYAIRGGVSTRIIATPGRPADIGVDTRRNHVAVPYIALDRVDIWALRDN